MKKKKFRRIAKLNLQLVLFTAFLSVCSGMTIESTGKTGIIKGSVVEKSSQKPLVGVNVLIKDTGIGAATNGNGEFLLENIPVGSYTVQFGYIGYEPLSLTDIIVRSERISFVQAELTESVIQGGRVVVSGGYFTEVKNQPVSAARFSSEEIRRAATVGGDINRIINGLPSLSNENQNNYIVARGGSTIENSFYIDNIRVPTINHFPIPGTTGGGVSFLNIDFIKNIDVHTGGFSARFGDVLSSVMDIRYREGNRKEIDFQTDLNFTGLSGSIEGPLGKGKGAWLLSAKHSFTDILFKIIGTDQEPVIYDEVQSKIVYDLSKKNRISLIHIYGNDRWKILRDEAISRSDNWYGNFGMVENVIGLNWRYLWGEKGFSNTSLSHSLVENDVRLLKTLDQSDHFTNRSIDQTLELRNHNYYIPSPNHRFEFGFEARLLLGEYRNAFASTTNQAGLLIPASELDNHIHSLKSGLFFNHIWNPVHQFTITSGLRLDHFTFNQHLLVSPRIALSYQIDEKTSVTGAAGIYYQHIPMYFLSQNTDFVMLRDMYSDHIVLGFNFMLSEDTRLTIEAYNKTVRHSPMDPDQASLYILDENIYNQFYSYHDNLVAEGRARSRGVEIMVQKKLSNHYYGLLSGSFFSSTYLDLSGVWRNRITDNRILAAAEIGYKPNAKWEFSLRWSYAGGLPYTPFDPVASLNAGTGVYDNSKIMAERLPAYSCFNVRIDRRFYFKGSNLIVYFSIWNLFNRENVSYHYWDAYAGNAGNYTQWPRLPVFGIEFEF